MKFVLPCLAVVVFSIAGCQTAQPNRFAKADSNHDKKLTRSEMNTYLVTEVFESRDTNKDGKLTKAEWLVGSDASQVAQFNKRDANKDGVVTLDEALAYGMKAGAAKDLEKAADTNKDGAVSEAEIASYYSSKEGPAR